MLQVIVFLWCSFCTEICADIGQGKCCVIDWKSQGKSGNFVLKDLYEPCVKLLSTFMHRLKTELFNVT